MRKERRLRVFRKRVLRRIFGPKRDDVTGEWGKLHNEELNNLYCSLNIVRVIKSRRIRWTGNVARMGRNNVPTGFWWGNLREREYLEDPSLDEMDFLRWIFRKWDWGGGKNWIDLAQDRDR
jgi:hypothetical protein